MAYLRPFEYQYVFQHCQVFSQGTQSSICFYPGPFADSQGFLSASILSKYTCFLNAQSAHETLELHGPLNLPIWLQRMQ